MARKISEHGSPPGGSVFDGTEVAIFNKDGVTYQAPFSTLLVWKANASALNSYVLSSLLGVNNGVATLNSSGVVPSTQLPSYVDDVLEFANLAAFPATGESGKIYIAVNAAIPSNPTRQYRWSGSVYSEINASPGTTDALTEGSTNQYFLGSRVLSTVLTGFSTGVSTVVSAADSILAAIGKLQAQVTANFALMVRTDSTNGEIATTGDFKFVQRASPPPGWIACAPTVATIGNVGSGATRANVDTLALFTAWWTDYPDARLPILTSAGAASTRGASAAADWAALKRMSVFNASGRFPRVVGTINGVTVVNGGLLADTFAAHNHGIGGDNVFGTAGTFSYYSGQNRATGVSESVGGPETAPVSIGMLGCYKL